MQLPAIDQNVCGQWIQQDNDFYNKLPVWFLAAENAYRKYFATWSGKISTGRFKWKANNGDTLKSIIPVPTPVQRQMAFPKTIASGTPLTDVVSYRERTTLSQPAWQDFMSNTFYFKPEWADFLGHVKTNKDNIMQQMIIYEDMYYRSFALAKAPYVWICGVGLVAAPTAEMNSTLDAANSKTAAWFSAQITALMGAADGTLSMIEVFDILNAAENEVGMTPYEGSEVPSDKAAQPLSEKYCIVVSGENWNQWVGDPWVKENRTLNMNIVTENFKGDLFGRATARIEKYQIHMQVDADNAPTFPEPEVTELNPDRENFGDTIPNPLYAKTQITDQSGATGGSPIGIAFLVGGPNYDIMDVGPPPSAFTETLNGINGMNWNGQINMTKNILVPCQTTGGETFFDMNSFGRYLRLQATSAVGARATNMKNILPIIYKRHIGLSNATP